MKEVKVQILFLLLFIVVGLAFVSTNLAANVNTPITGNPSDFYVYFSDVLLDGTQDLSLVRSEKELVFNSELSSIGDKKNISYDITNASKMYDARISINCTGGNSYIKVTNTFDEKNDLTARSTKSGTLTVELLNAVSEEVSYEVKCTINATAIERDSTVTSDVANPVERVYLPGTELIYRGETFHVIKDNGATISLLARYNINDAYYQTSDTSYVKFSDSTGWAATPRPQEVDIQLFDGPVKTYLNGYVARLKSDLDVNDITGSLITLKQLGDLGCVVSSDYSYISGMTCVDSPNSSWLVNGQNFWTSSVYDTGGVWRVGTNGGLNYAIYNPSYGVRPVITVSSDIFEKMVNAPQTVCESNGWDYGKDTGTNYFCSSVEDLSYGCTYTYGGTSTGGCTAPR